MIPTLFYPYFQNNAPPPPAPRRTLRDIARRDRTRVMASAMGVAEDVTWTPAGGSAVAIRGVWRETPSDQRQPYGIGVEAEVSRAWLDIADTACPGLTRADTFSRIGTGEVWQVEQLEQLVGFGVTITLSKITESLTRSGR